MTMNPAQHSIPYTPYEGSLNLRLTAEDRQKLTRLAAILGVDENEAIRRAISDALFIRNQILGGSKIVLASPNEKGLREIEFK